MISKQYLPPAYWQDFEALCIILFKSHLKSGHVTQNGKQGNKQDGVDLFGYDEHRKLFGVQCKLKDNRSKATFSIQALRDEVNKAKGFQPKLHTFIVATTASNIQELEKEARIITDENSKNGFFKVMIYGWDNLRLLIDQNEEAITQFYSHNNSNDDDPNRYIYDYWVSRFPRLDVILNAWKHPNNYTQVEYSLKFVETLEAFNRNMSAQLNVVKDLDVQLNDGILDFMAVAKDIYEYIKSSETSEVETCQGFRMLRLNTTGLNSDDQWQYVEYKKMVLRHLFSELIRATNFIADKYQKLTSSKVPTYPPIIPHMRNLTLKFEGKYQGLQAIKDSVVFHFFSKHPVLEWEKSLDTAPENYY